MKSSTLKENLVVLDGLQSAQGKSDRVRSVWGPTGKNTHFLQVFFSRRQNLAFWALTVVLVELEDNPDVGKRT